MDHWLGNGPCWLGNTSAERPPRPQGQSPPPPASRAIMADAVRAHLLLVWHASDEAKLTRGHLIPRHTATLFFLWQRRVSTRMVPRRSAEVAAEAWRQRRQRRTALASKKACSATKSSLIVLCSSTVSPGNSPIRPRRNAWIGLRAHICRWMRDLLVDHAPLSTTNECASRAAVSSAASACS
eukprot:SAG11_NODE_6371_length_1327_cov_1.305375_2_plen_182_part_00